MSRIFETYVFLRPYISDLSNFTHIIITILVCFMIKDQKHGIVMIGRKLSNLHTYFISDLHKQKFHSCKPGTLAGGASCEKKAPEEALAAAKEMLGDAWRVEIVSLKGSSYVYK